MTSEYLWDTINKKQQERKIILLPTLRHADNYRINFSNKMSFDEINESTATNAHQLTAGWICLSIASHANLKNSSIPHFLKAGANLFTEVAKENDGSFTANPFLLPNEVLKNIEVGYSVVPKNKSFPDNHLSDDSYFRHHYSSKVDVDLSEGEDEIFVSLMNESLARDVEHDNLSIYTLEEMYEYFEKRTHEMPMLNTHWNSLILSMENIAFAGNLVKLYIENGKNGSNIRKHRISFYHVEILKMISEYRIFKVARKPEQSIKLFTFDEFKLLFSNEIEVDNIIKEKYLPKVEENEEEKHRFMNALKEFEENS